MSEQDLSTRPGHRVTLDRETQEFVLSCGCRFPRTLGDQTFANHVHEDDPVLPASQTQQVEEPQTDE
jgi:hypothetical protein